PPTGIAGSVQDAQFPSSKLSIFQQIERKDYEAGRLADSLSSGAEFVLREREAQTQSKTCRERSRRGSLACPHCRRRCRELLKGPRPAGTASPDTSHLVIPTEAGAPATAQG